MTQIVVTLENGADSSLLQKMIENMKGVLRTSVKQKTHSKETEQESEWLQKLHELKNSIDKSAIDYSDERTRYIMSK